MNHEIKPGIRSGIYNPGDTLTFIPGTYDYFTADGTSGTSDQPIRLIFQNGVKFTSGFDMSNVNWIIFDGGGTAKNLLIEGATGVPLSFKGKCNNIVIDGIRINGAYSYIWFKTEVAEQSFANWSYWTKVGDKIEANYIMDGLTVRNFDFRDAKFDGGYISSTGQKADRPIKMPDGITYYPFPPKVANVKFENGVIDGAARTGLQISGLVSSESWLDNVTIKNCGTSLEAYQGACFLLGGNSSKIKITGCMFDGSHLYAVRTDGGGLIEFTNNTVLNSTTVNGAQNTEKMAAVQFDSYEADPATFVITGNKVDASNNGVSVVVYGNERSVSANSVFANNQLAGQFQNLSGVQFGTGDVVEPPPDEVKLSSVKLILKMTDGSTLDLSNFTKALKRADGSYKITFADGTFKIYSK